MDQAETKHSPIMDANRWQRIPLLSRIRVLHEDSSILVIIKPNNLRSVPGNAAPTVLSETTAKVSDAHAHTDPAVGSKRPRHPESKTSQEAWIAALESFQPPTSAVDRNSSHIESDRAHRWAKKLGTLPKTSLVSIPRKLKPFLRYYERNQMRLLPEGETRISSKSNLEALATDVHGAIEQRQRSLLHLPQATKHEDSAFGQLILMGYTHKQPHQDEVQRSSQNLFVVHRLDCETSGVMVFARTREAASFLGQAWRTRDQVVKTYVARVKRWPPYECNQETEGAIDLPLIPSPEERLKWKVVDDTNLIERNKGKPSKTLWKFRTSVKDLITLDLTPITGRTHQLRVHLAAVGSGIDGDTLYGDNPVPWDPSATGERRLALHAQQLSFPHPQTKTQMTFSAEAAW